MYKLLKIFKDNIVLGKLYIPPCAAKEVLFNHIESIH